MAVSTFAFAQERSFSVKGGLNFNDADIVLDGVEISDDVEITCGLNLGAYFDNKFSNYNNNFFNKISVELGLQFEQKGYKYAYVLGSTKTEKECLVNYLSLPYHVKFNLPISKCNLYFLMGGNMGLAISGTTNTKTTIKNTSLSQEDDIKFGNDKDYDMCRDYEGFDLGVGFEFPNKMGVRLVADLGANSLPKDQKNSSTAFNSVSLSVTYKLFSNKKSD